MRVAKALAAAAATAVLVGAGPAPSPDTSWFVIVADGGAVIGYASSQTTVGPTGRETVQTQELTLREEGASATRVSETTVRREDKAGRTLAISSRSRTGRSWVRTDVKFTADRAEITRETPSDRRTTVVRLPPGVRVDAGDGLLKTWDPATHPRLSFEALSIDGATVDRVTIEPAPGAVRDDSGGLTVIRRRFEGDDLRGISRLLLDRDNRIVAVVQPMFGSTITIRASDRAMALQPRPPYRVLANVMTRSPFRISDTAAGGQIRYRFGFRDGLEFGLPRTGEQRVTEMNGTTVLDICAGCGPGLPDDPKTLAHALRPTAWLQSDHPRLKRIVGPVARLDISDARKMEMLESRARPYLRRIDFAGHFSALETLSRRSGDCTEAAVLLAAMGRAAGIPTRVVNGLVYSRERYHGVGNVFMPHSWVLAYVDGNWRSYDAALEGFDSTHIALTIGDGDARSVLAAGQLGSLLQWESMAEVRARPG